MFCHADIGIAVENVWSCAVASRFKGRADLDNAVDLPASRQDVTGGDARATSKRLAAQMKLRCPPAAVGRERQASRNKPIQSVQVHITNSDGLAVGPQMINKALCSAGPGIPTLCVALGKEQ
jgi:hypothetical protein